MSSLCFNFTAFSDLIGPCTLSFWDEARGIPMFIQPLDLFKDLPKKISTTFGFYVN